MCVGGGGGGGWGKDWGKVVVQYVKKKEKKRRECVQGEWVGQGEVHSVYKEQEK